MCVFVCVCVCSCYIVSTRTQTVSNMSNFVWSSQHLRSVCRLVFRLRLSVLACACARLGVCAHGRELVCKILQHNKEQRATTVRASARRTTASRLSKSHTALSATDGDSKHQADRSNPKSLSTEANGPDNYKLRRVGITQPGKADMGLRMALVA